MKSMGTLFPSVTVHRIRFYDVCSGFQHMPRATYVYLFRLDRVFRGALSIDSVQVQRFLLYMILD